MRFFFGFSMLAAATAAVTLAGIEPAAAKIRCEGRYQINPNSRIATPYCADEYLASVARQYGARVTGSQMRRNESLKADTCRLVGRDNRVSDICANYVPELGPGRRP